MNKTYFVRFKSNQKYKDIVTSVSAKEGADHSSIQEKAILKIAKRNSWTMEDFHKYGYEKVVITEEGEGYVYDMVESKFTSVVIMKNGLPIAIAPTAEQAKRVIVQMKADKAVPPGIYKTYEVSQWVSEKTAENSKYTITKED